MQVRNKILAMMALLSITSSPLQAEPANQTQVSSKAAQSQGPAIIEQGGNLVAAPSSDGDSKSSSVAPPPPSANTDPITVGQADGSNPAKMLPEGAVMPPVTPVQPGTINPDIKPAPSTPSATGN